MRYKHLLWLSIFIFFSAVAIAQDPGHPASAIGPGQFYSGNYSFPDSVFINTSLGVGVDNTAYGLEVAGRIGLDSTIYTLASGWVGIGTSAPTTMLDVAGIINSSEDIRVNETSVCLSDGTNCPAGSTDQNLFETITSDSGSAVADIATDTLTILGESGIQTNITNDDLTVRLVGSQIPSDEIPEAAIDFDTACASGNHLFINGNNLDCEADDDQPDSDAEVPDAITISGGTIGSNTIPQGTVFTLSGNLSIDTLHIEGGSDHVGIGTQYPSKKLQVNGSAGSITLDPDASSPTINTTDASDLIISSASGNVVIKLG